LSVKRSSKRSLFGHGIKVRRKREKDLGLTGKIKGGLAIIAIIDGRECYSRLGLIFGC
jgi:hypothetical protein